MKYKSLNKQNFLAFLKTQKKSNLIKKQKEKEKIQRNKKANVRKLEKLS